MTQYMEERRLRLRHALRRGRGALRAFTALLLMATTVGAEGLDAERFTFRGFGTLGATLHDAEGIEYRRYVGQSRGARADDLDFATDSLAGLQLNARLTDSLDASLQGVTRLNVQGNWSPRVTHAFLRYSPDQSLVLRAGRFGYEIYLLAESRQVGYSYLTVRPSQDFYGLVTNDEVDGLDVAWTGRLGRGLVKARLFGGVGTDETAFADGSTWKGQSDVIGASFDYSLRAVTARLAMLQVTYGPNPDLRGLGQALIATGVPPSVSIGEELTSSEQRSRGLQFGLAYDEGPLQGQLLYGHILSDSISGPNVDALYAQVGYRMGDWTPYLAYARSRDRDPLRVTGLPPAPPLLPLIGAVEAIQTGVRATQHSTSLGLRWDVARNCALKLQADFAKLGLSALNFDRRPPGSGDASMTVLTATLDFVF